MAEIKKEMEKSPKQGTVTTPQQDEVMAPKKRISLIEMIMILMLVGLVFVFVFPFKQMIVDKEQEAIARQKFEAALPSFQVILDAAEAYKKQDEFGAYPILIDELNLTNINTEFFKFEFSDQGPTITAISTEAFGKKDVKVSYNFATKIYSVTDETPKTMPTIKEDWLP